MHVCLEATEFCMVADSDQADSIKLINAVVAESLVSSCLCTGTQSR